MKIIFQTVKCGNRRKCRFTVFDIYEMDKVRWWHKNCSVGISIKLLRKNFLAKQFPYHKEKLYFLSNISCNPWEGGLLNTVGKGENSGFKHFLLFTQCFLSFQRQIPSYFKTCKKPKCQQH